VCLHPTPATAPRPLPAPAVCPAHALAPPQRQALAVQALAHTQPLAVLARQHDVSRKFVYQQADKAQQALDQAFAPSSPPDGLLFWLPVTQSWLRQLVLGLVLIGHSSIRGVTELLADLFDYPVAVGTVHNILTEAVAAARPLNGRYDLTAVRLAALDELFQAGSPVLVGVDVHSTFCCLLSLEEHRDADTWGVRLLELAERGFHPDATLADFAGGLRAGQAEVLPDVPCRGDVFHVLHVAVPLVTYLDNRAYEAIATRSKLERQQAQYSRRQGRKAATLSGKLGHARPAETQAVALAEDVAVLIRWLREDILAVAGPDLATRQELYDWVVAELRAREGSCAHRIRPVRTLLENQRAALLAFAAALDRELQTLAADYAVSPAVVREVLHVQALPACAARRGQREAALGRRWGSVYAALRDEVTAVAAQVVRASSVVENLNSRLRNYFFLRRQVGPDYLALLQFFLNHRRFRRSEHPEREGKSPAELLTGVEQPHWLELLGYTRFSCN